MWDSIGVYGSLFMKKLTLITAASVRAAASVLLASIPAIFNPVFALFWEGGVGITYIC